MSRFSRTVRQLKRSVQRYSSTLGDPNEFQVRIQQNEEQDLLDNRVKVDIAELEVLLTDPADIQEVKDALEEALLNLGIGIQVIEFIATGVKAGRAERFRTAQASVEMLFDGMHMPVDITQPPAIDVVDNMRDRLYVILNDEQRQKRVDIKDGPQGVEAYVVNDFVPAQFANFQALSRVSGMAGVGNYINFDTGVVTNGFRNIHAIYANPAYVIIAPPGIDHVVGLGNRSDRLDILREIVADAALAMATIDYNTVFAGHDAHPVGNPNNWWNIPANRALVYDRFVEEIKRAIEAKLAELRVKEVKTKEGGKVTEDQRVYRKGVIGKLRLIDEFGIQPLIDNVPGRRRPRFEEVFINISEANVEYDELVQDLTTGLRNPANYDIPATGGTPVSFNATGGINWGNGGYTQDKAESMRDQIDGKLDRLYVAMRDYLRYLHGEDYAGDLNEIVGVIIIQIRQNLLGTPVAPPSNPNNQQVADAIWNDYSNLPAVPNPGNCYQLRLIEVRYDSPPTTQQESLDGLSEIHQMFAVGNINIAAQRRIRILVEAYVNNSSPPLAISNLSEAGATYVDLINQLDTNTGFNKPGDPTFIGKIKMAILWIYAGRQTPPLPLPPGLHNPVAGVIHNDELVAVVNLRTEIVTAHASSDPNLVVMQEIGRIYCEQAILLINDDIARYRLPRNRRAVLRLTEARDEFMTLAEYVSNPEYPLPPTGTVEPLPPTQVIDHIENHVTTRLVPVPELGGVDEFTVRTNVLDSIRDQIDIATEQIRILSQADSGTQMTADAIDQFMDEGWQKRNGVNKRTFRADLYIINNPSDLEVIRQQLIRIRDQKTRLESVRQGVEDRIKKMREVAENLQMIGTFVDMMDALVEEHDAAVTPSGQIKSVEYIGDEATTDARAETIENYTRRGQEVFGYGIGGLSYLVNSSNPLALLVLLGIEGTVDRYSGRGIVDIDKMLKKKYGDLRAVEDVARAKLDEQAQLMIDNDINNINTLKDPTGIEDLRTRLNQAMIQFTRLASLPPPPNTSGSYAGIEFMVWLDQINSAMEQVKAELGDAIEAFVIAKLRNDTNGLWTTARDLYAAVRIDNIDMTPDGEKSIKVRREQLQEFIDIRQARMGWWNKAWRGHKKLRKMKAINGLTTP